MTKTKLNNIHPGEILLEEFIIPMKLSQNKLARHTGVPPRRINEICLGKRAITVDTAIRLGKYFGTEAVFWLNLQNMYDMEELKAKKAMIYDKIVRYEMPKTIKKAS